MLARYAGLRNWVDPSTQVRSQKCWHICDQRVSGTLADQPNLSLPPRDSFSRNKVRAGRADPEGASVYVMCKPEGLSLIPRAHGKIGENQLHKIDLHMCTEAHSLPHHTHNHNKGENVEGQHQRSTSGLHLPTHAHRCIYTQWKTNVDRLFLGLQGTTAP